MIFTIECDWHINWVLLSLSAVSLFCPSKVLFTYQEDYNTSITVIKLHRDGALIRENLCDC